MDSNKRLIVESFSCPYFNVAVEDTLIASCYDLQIPILRIWTTPSLAICLGASQRWKEHVSDHALRENIPVVRRSSGGGAVLHCSGNLNYSFFLPLEKGQPYFHLKDSYSYFFHLLQPFFHSLNLPIQFQPLCDFSLHNKKISGHAQKRSCHILLHHGTFLVEPPLDLISSYLKEPSDQPPYRKGRLHCHFITSIKKEGFSFSIEFFQQSLIQYFSDFSLSSLTSYEKELTQKLTLTRYQNHEWIFKF